MPVKRRDKMKKRLGVLLLAMLMAFSALSSAQGAVTWGSTGDTVRRIQQKLRQYGYMSGAADGVFGKETYDAVVFFQKRNGLKADGVVGNATAAALGISLGSSSVPASQSESEVYLLARLIQK